MGARPPTRGWTVFHLPSTPGSQQSSDGKRTVESDGRSRAAASYGLEGLVTIVGRGPLLVMHRARLLPGRGDDDSTAGGEGPRGPSPAPGSLHLSTLSPRSAAPRTLDAAPSYPVAASESTGDCSDEIPLPLLSELRNSRGQLAGALSSPSPAGLAILFWSAAARLMRRPDLSRCIIVTGRCSQPSDCPPTGSCCASALAPAVLCPMHGATPDEFSWTVSLSPAIIVTSLYGSSEDDDERRNICS